MVGLQEPAAALHTTAAAQPSKPNFLVILTDDVGWGDYACYNPQSKISAPNVDRLAREGMRFTHTPAALCAPTRYSLLTGNCPWRGRAAGSTWGFHVPSQILPGQKTVANLLQDAGYHTAMFGKQGFGGEHAKLADGNPDFTKPLLEGPRAWGFDYSAIIPRGHQRDDSRPVRRAMLIDSSPGRDVNQDGGFSDARVVLTRDATAAARKPVPAAKAQPAARAKPAGKAKTAGKIRPDQAAAMPSHGIAHALYEGDFKLILDIAHDAPAALYDLKNDLAEQKNLIAEPAHAERVNRLEAIYRAIRASKRSVDLIAAPPVQP